MPPTQKLMGYSPTNTAANCDLDALVASIAAGGRVIPYDIRDMPSWHGTVGTDESVAIAEAVTLAAASGGAVRFPAGDIVGTLECYSSGVWAIGAGSQLTKLTQPAATYRSVADAAINNGTATLSSATANFTATDLRKTVYVAGAGPSSNLVARIIAILGPTSVTLSQNAQATVVGAVCRIGTGRHVIEFGPAWMANSGPLLQRCGVIGMTLDGNRANVSAPADANDDLVNAGVMVTNVSYFFALDVVAQNNYNTGIYLAINSNFHRIAQVRTINNGVSALNRSGVEVDSSSFGTVVGHVSESDQYGVIYNTNIFGCLYDGVIRRSLAQGVTLNCNNVAGNSCVGNTIRAAVEEAAGAGANIQGRWRGNTIDLTVGYAGSTRTAPDTWTVNSAAVGLLLGSSAMLDTEKPSGNRVRLVALRCGGSGVVIQANYNLLDLVIVECSQSGQGASFGVELNGSWNQVSAVFQDLTFASGNWKQRGIAIRAVGGEPVGSTPATNNSIFGVVGAQVSTISDAGTGTAILGLIDQVSGAGKRITYTAAAPAAGPWNVGDVAFNTAPVSGGTIGWVCTTAGTPGTWKTWGTIA